MLEELLKSLAKGGVQSYSDLEKALGVSEELLSQMIEDLVRMGYLEPVMDHCTERCEDCPLEGVCALGGRGRSWTLTEKGKRAVSTSKAVGT
jgi:hypothetical protein